MNSHRGVSYLVLVSVGIVSMLEAQSMGAAPSCQWDYGQAHTMHWAQWPDYSTLGVDVDAAGTLADDFLATASAPVWDVHLWGSFEGDVLPSQGPGSLVFDMAIHADIPAQGPSPSRPGKVLWSRQFGQGQYTVRMVHDGPQGWASPAIEQYLPDDHRKAYQYDFCISGTPLVVEEGTVYWLAVKATVPLAGASRFGLKTALSRFAWNDSEVRLADTGQWAAMAFPKGHVDAGLRMGLGFVITGGSGFGPTYDLGDAPDSSNSLPGSPMTAYPATATEAIFPTVYRIGSPPYGPLHRSPRGCMYLGPRVSLEQEADLGFDQDPTNNLDVPNDRPDLDAGDDGVVLPLALPHCKKATFDYSVTVTDLLYRSVYVNVWFDWNRDGDWDDALDCTDSAKVNEWAVQNQQVQLSGPGSFTVTTPEFSCWHGEASDQPSPLWMRITIAEQAWRPPMILIAGLGGSGPAEGYQYGETEDYLLYPTKSSTDAEFDWGDAPEGDFAPAYPTLRVHNGAYHRTAGPWFGDDADRPDPESDGQPDPNAMGDDLDLSKPTAVSDDEDGVSIPPLACGQNADVTLEVRGGGGIVEGWIDFDHDKNWESAEQVVNQFLPNGIHSVGFAVPNDALPGLTFARFRISRKGGVGPAGPAADGEVEDHRVIIWRLPSQTKWVQMPDTTPNGVDMCLDSNDLVPRHMADDFNCTCTGHITQITLWGSWKRDKVGAFKKIHVEIHPDDPVGPLGADTTNRYSKPRPEVLWSMDFLPSQFQPRLYHTVYAKGEWWQDKVKEALNAGGDRQIWQVDLNIDPSLAFLQTGTPDFPVIYWLHVTADTEDGEFGWKTRRWPDHFMDDAVWDLGTELPRLWKELRYVRPHPYYGLRDDSMDLAFLLTCQAHSEFPTSQPTSITTCPPVDTTCPAVLTQCPAVLTQCPVVVTQCPSGVTFCPATDTRCPAVDTACPVMQTSCPAVETQCPVTETQCPVVDTRCPAAKTRCPTAKTQCPVVETQCPLVQTQCPPVSTECPATETRCPPIDTKCPVTETQCPESDTQCPVVDTRCPGGPTQCQSAPNQCPVVTQCPAADTRCPESNTKCPAVETQVSGGGDAVSSLADQMSGRSHPVSGSADPVPAMPDGRGRGWHDRPRDRGGDLSSRGRRLPGLRRDANALRDAIV